MSGLKLQAYTMRSGLRTAVTLLVALAAAQLCVWLHTPIPWMLGPLLVTALASVLGAPTRSAPLLRNAGQWVIGVVLGLYFTPQVGALVAACGGPSRWRCFGRCCWAPCLTLGCSIGTGLNWPICHPVPGGRPLTLPVRLVVHPR